MLSLELTKVPGTLEEFKPKTKKDAGGKMPCAELTISCPLQDAKALAFFGPDLEDMLFNKSGPHDLAGGPPLRDTGMKLPVERKEEMGGATLKLGVGIGAPMQFDSVECDTFRITPMSGGSVILVFRVKCMPTEAQAGRLYMLQEQPLEVTVEPCESPEMQAAA